MNIYIVERFFILYPINYEKWHQIDFNIIIKFFRDKINY